MTTLADLHHYIGGDLSASNTGDLTIVTDTERGKQRVLRRLLTNPGAYIFHPDYGAGLPQWIGRNADLAEIRALIRGQMALEAAVAKRPEPNVRVAQISDSDGGGFSVSIQYNDATSGQPVSLNFDVSN